MTRRRRWYLATGAVLALVLAAAAGLAAVTGDGSGPPIRTRVQFVSGTPEGHTPVRLDTTLYLPAHTPAPAVLLAHGFGGSKESVAGEARDLARAGFVVLAYSARGFGRSGGLVHLDAPDYEVHDAHLLVNWLEARSVVARSDGRAQIAVAGSSYGGALALLLAAADHRIVAVGADITWNDLVSALFPNDGGATPGVFKKFWASTLFAGAVAASGAQTSCGRFDTDACLAFQYAAATGAPNSALLTVLRAASPSRVLDRITAPVLLTQGEQDSLFGLDQALANARGLTAHGTPVRMVWRLGGHDAPGTGSGEVVSALIPFLRSAFAGRVHGAQPFEIEQAGTVRSGPGELHVARIPGLAGAPQPQVDVAVSGPAQTVLAPAGGSPAAVTSLPQLSTLIGAAGSGAASAGAAGAGGPAGQSDLAGLSGLSALPSLSALPGQVAVFTSAPLRHDVRIAGAPTVRLRITAHDTRDATLFASLRDLDGDAGGVAAASDAAPPAGLVAPVHLTGLQPGVARTVTVRLPAIVRDVPAGHRLVLTVSTTDAAYQLPSDPRSYSIALAGAQAGTANVDVPTVHASVHRAALPWAWLIVGLVVTALLALGVTLELLRRRRRLRPDPALVDVPVVVSGLVKDYGGGYRAVDGVSFRVERGQIVGLLGRNGAGKTTVLRTLVGLLTPTDGTIRVFGDTVAPGAAVLARVGALIEGPGFLPHLSGRDNLRLYWAASGRPNGEAHFDRALSVAGLGAAIERPVRAYSHGMKQRLGIAQALLGLPDLLVLDEPTDGLDPPQIVAMRAVLRDYAATGRTVLVSSHLLAEVEQTCTHVVVMHRGRLVAAGSVTDVIGGRRRGGGVQLAVDNPSRAMAVLAASGIETRAVPVQHALEDVFLGLTGEDDQ